MASELVQTSDVDLGKIAEEFFGGLRTPSLSLNLAPGCS